MVGPGAVVPGALVSVDWVGVCTGYEAATYEAYWASGGAGG